MIIACPSCDTRFEVNAAALPAAGRKVKCARCAHVWLQRPEGAAQAEIADDPAPQIVIARPIAPVAPLPELPAEMIWAGTDIPRRRPGYGAYIAVAVAGIAVLFAASLAFPAQVTAYIPAMGRVYAALGLPVDTSGLELSIEAKSMNAAAQGGASTLVVTGVIANVTEEERPVPRIAATLMAEDKRELHSWTFDAGVATLKPGETHTFVQELAQPPADTYQVYAHFAEAGQ